MLVEKIALREWLSIAKRYEMRAVRTIEEIRHARLLELLESPDFPTIQALADRLGKSHAQVSQWKNKSERRNPKGEVVGYSNIDSASARAIEATLGKPRGWMDNDTGFHLAQSVSHPMLQDETTATGGRGRQQPPVSFDAEFSKMRPTEQKRFLHLWAASFDDPPEPTGHLGGIPWEPTAKVPGSSPGKTKGIKQPLVPLKRRDRE